MCRIPANRKMLEQRIVAHEFKRKRRDRPASGLCSKSERLDALGLSSNERHLAAPVHAVLKDGQQLDHVRVIGRGAHLEYLCA